MKQRNLNNNKTTPTKTKQPETFLELFGDGGRARLVVSAAEVPRPQSTCAHWPRPRHNQSQSFFRVGGCLVTKVESAMKACSAAWSFTMSWLNRLPLLGANVDVFSVQEVPESL